MRLLFSFLAGAVLLLFLLGCKQASGFAEDQSCGGSASWVRGGPYNEMRIAKYSTSTTGCVLTITSPSGPLTTYNASQQFTVRLTSPLQYGYKVVTLGGAKISSPSSGGSLEGDECLNYHAKKLSATFRVTAPAKGAEIRVKALCGTDEKAMHVATDIVLQPGPDVSPPVAEVSTDPNYAYQKPMAGNMMLHFKQNASHVSFKVEYNAVGYVSFGVGSAMVPAVVMVGMDPTANSGYNAVGLYRLVAKSGSNAQIAQLLAGPTTLASTYGIVDASFSVVSGVSTMKFSVLLNSQHADFQIADPAGVQGVDVNYAAGSAAFGMHSIAGSFLKMNFASGVSSGSGSNSGGGSGPGANPTTPTSGGVSSDPNYAFMTDLNHAIKLFYKKNDTHGSFKMTMKNGGYLSIGTTLLMVGSVAVVGMDPAQNPGYPSVGLYSITAKTGSNAQIMSNLAVTPATLAQYGIVDTAFGVDSTGTSFLKFAVELLKQQSQFTLLPTTGPSEVDFIWAGGPAVYGYHTYAGAVPKANFAAALGASLGFEVDVNLAAHIVLMIIAWEFLGPFGVIVPLFNNAKHGVPGLCRLSAPAWLKFHWIALAIGVIAGYGGSLAGYLFVESKRSTHWSTLHKSLGLFLLLASIVQPIWGMLRPKKAKTGSEKSLRRKVFEFGHPVFGYVLVVIGLANSVIGMDELTKLAGGGMMNFSGMATSSGWSGALGASILALTVVFCLLLAMGFMRSIKYNWQRGSQSQASGSSPAKSIVADTHMGQSDRVVTQGELLQHATSDSCWVVYNSTVYDVSAFLSSHPGGKKAITPYAGKDMTTAFDDIGHSAEALSRLSKYVVGRLEGGAGASKDELRKVDPERGDDVSGAVFLSGGNQVRRQVKLTEKTTISHNVFLLRFGLPSPTMSLGLPTGKHVCLFAPNIPGKVKGQWNGAVDAEAGQKEIQRKYTPVSSAREKGSFTLIVKCYRRDAKSFPDGGKMSRYLDSLKVGDTVHVAGPFGTHQYLGAGRFMDNGQILTIRNVGMVAGGSGITPVLQIARAMLEDPSDPCKISVVYSNSSCEDILMKSTLHEFATAYPHRFKVWYTVSKTPTTGTWHYSTGRISEELFKKYLPFPSKDCIIISCGPPPMLQSATAILKKIGFGESQLIEY